MRAIAVTWATAWRQAWANRRGFWTQVGLMGVNDAIWLIFWTLFFRRVGDVRGWDINQILVLFAALTTSGGFVLGLLSNVRHIGAMATAGELDATLALPVPTLPHLLVGRVETLFVGDLFFGITIFIVFGNPTPQRAAVFAFGVVCAIATLTGFLVLIGSLSFWVGRNESSDLGFHALLLFSSYPVDIFTGATKLLLYGLIPAAFVSSVPARLVTGFDPVWAAAMAAVGLALVGAGATAFNLGLRRYTSGSIWTTA